MLDCLRVIAGDLFRSDITVSEITPNLVRGAFCRIAEAASCGGIKTRHFILPHGNGCPHIVAFNRTVNPEDFGIIEAAFPARPAAPRDGTGCVKRQTVRNASPWVTR